jgi:prepilin-type N-terminal cleavage/methylation domain-containing protein
MLNTTCQRGMTLAELMISLAVSSFIVLAAATHYTITYRTTILTQKTSARTSEYGRVESVVSAAIRESGFLYSMENLIAHLTYTADLNGSTLETYVQNVYIESNCVLVKIGTSSTPYRQLGFRLENGVIQTSSGSGLDCSSGSWTAITSSTTLSYETFAVSQSGSTSYYNADDPDESSPSLTYNQCFDSTRAANCAATKLWLLSLCALPPDSSAVTCDDTTTSHYSALLIAPRNPVLTGATSN